MNVDFSDQEIAFQQEVRQFLNDKLPKNISQKIKNDMHLDKADLVGWQQILAKLLSRVDGVQTILVNADEPWKEGPELIDGADAVVTGRGTIDGRPIMVIANDPTVKAGSWGRLTVEKIIRALEAAYDELLPVFFLVDSAGARITDQVARVVGESGVSEGLVLVNA